MNKKKGPFYKRQGLEFRNIEFSNQAEKKFVKDHIKRIAQSIKIKRTEKNLTQEKLAELSCISLSTIKFIEQNQRAPSLPMLLKLMFFLDRDIVLWPMEGDF